ncbi:MAG: FAD-dependent oxidoreductase [Pseudomonadales bacterium]
MPREFHTDIAILGGGIGGLWILNHLREQGYRALLFEKDSLGNGQTIASQGMIHGGIKYTLGGSTTESSESMADMPELWRQCLAGGGPLDLRGVQLLSEDYFLFSDDRLTSRLTAFFGSKSLRGRIEPLKPGQYPRVFSDGFKGALYRMQDIVVDTSSLIHRLEQKQANYIFQGEAILTLKKDGPVLRLGDGSSVQANYCVLAAGAGNEDILKGAGLDQIPMQRRPLHQVMVKASHLPSLYAHAVSMKTGAKPRLTITTHHRENGEPVWYLGGDLAETGVHRSAEEQIRVARNELDTLLPWISLQGADWATLRIDRAEPAQPENNRPGNVFAKAMGPIIVCWPTKLTLAPVLATQVDSLLPSPRGATTEQLPNLPAPEVAKPPWELLF